MGVNSIEAWDDLQNNRLQHLDQIALGIVLMRWQRAHRNHFSLEQPQKLTNVQTSLHAGGSADVAGTGR